VNEPTSAAIIVQCSFQIHLSVVIFPLANCASKTKIQNNNHASSSRQ